MAKHKDLWGLGLMCFEKYSLSYLCVVKKHLTPFHKKDVMYLDSVREEGTHFYSGVPSCWVSLDPTPYKQPEQVSTPLHRQYNRYCMNRPCGRN